MVKEDRLYLSWPSKDSKLKENAFVKESDGILSAKRAINELHRWLGEQGYTQVTTESAAWPSEFELVSSSLFCFLDPS